MATTRRDTPLGLGKDKKPTKSLSRIRTTPTSNPLNNKRSPKETTSSTTTTSTNTKSRLPDKNVGNHLKPTAIPRPDISSSSSPSSPTSRVKKQDNTQKRRSFDKPISVSRSQNASPSTKKLAPSTTTTTSADKPTKVAVKSNAPVRTVRRSLTSPANPKKVSAKAPTSPTKKTIARKSSSETAAPALLAPPLLVEDKDVSADEVQEIANIGSDEDLVPFDRMELPEINSDTSSDVAPMFLVPQETIKANDSYENSDVAEESCVCAQESDEGNELGKGKIPEVEDDKQAAKDQVSDAEEGEKLASVSAPTPPKPEPSKHQLQQQGDKDKGKKDSNDVIEETASKLLEKRKNRVKALVGAFETVMSLQE